MSKYNGLLFFDCSVGLQNVVYQVALLCQLKLLYTVLMVLEYLTVLHMRETMIYSTYYWQACQLRKKVSDCF